jgi:hypothetical protein
MCFPLSCVVWTGVGYSCRPLLRECKASSIEATLVAAFSADSDNVAEANHLAAACNFALFGDSQAAPVSWGIPLSWERAQNRQN